MIMSYDTTMRYRFDLRVVVIAINELFIVY